MNRLARLVLIFMTMLPLVLSLATVALWVRSYGVVDSIMWNGSRTAAKLSTSDCTVELWCLPGHLDGRGGGWSYEASENNRPEYVWGRYEFRVDGQLKVALPYWLLCSGSAVLAVIFAVVRRPCRPGPLGLCPTCGYDLRATPTHCPECGTAPPRPGV